MRAVQRRWRQRARRTTMSRPSAVHSRPPGSTMTQSTAVGIARSAASPAPPAAKPAASPAPAAPAPPPPTAAAARRRSGILYARHYSSSTLLSHAHRHLPLAHLARIERTAQVPISAPLRGASASRPLPCSSPALQRTGAPRRCRPPSPRRRRARVGASRRSTRRSSSRRRHTCCAGDRASPQRCTAPRCRRRLASRRRG